MKEIYYPLRENIRKQPDPAKRFEEWLTKRANSRWGHQVPDAVFNEQPYLGWAELVDRAIEQSEKELRKSIADEILNPSDC